MQFDRILSPPTIIKFFAYFRQVVMITLLCRKKLYLGIWTIYYYTRKMIGEASLTFRAYLYFVVKKNYNEHEISLQ